jgi:hypothetical protein
MILERVVSKIHVVNLEAMYVCVYVCSEKVRW